MAVDEEYYQRHINIKALLYQAYCDKFFIESVDSFYSRSSEINSYVIPWAQRSISHICELAKRDLALTIYKIYFDNGKDTYTIKDLNSYLHSRYEESIKLEEKNNIEKLRLTIKDARNNYIAHDLTNVYKPVLIISDLFNALEDIRTLFNKLSIELYDSRVKPLTDTDVFLASVTEKAGWDFMTNTFLGTLRDHLGTLHDHKEGE